MHRKHYVRNAGPKAIASRHKTLLLAAILLFSRTIFATPPPQTSHNQGEKSWKFAVSGDSRNCGDVVMPAVALAVKRSKAQFYWHLGDFRRIAGIDEDIQHQPQYTKRPLTMPEYLDLAWNDFITHQLEPFGSLRVYLGRGNHDAISPKTEADFLTQFNRWLDTPELRAQRLKDDPSATSPRTYYHWIERGIDFINLDNAVDSEFGHDQVAWFEKILLADSSDPNIRTIVVGMHEALPESISKNHSMNQSESGVETGDRVYADLLKARDEVHKNIYVLASHSHYFMDGIFNTDYWRQHGGVLPGWIIGTAGAVRYPLPPEASAARAAKTNVYGFLLASVNPNDTIDFQFQQLNESDLKPGAVHHGYTADFVHWCVAENSQSLQPDQVR